MSAPGSTGKCPQCGAMVRWATLGPTGEAVAVEPVSAELLMSFSPHEPYRNVQAIQALVPHAKRCGKKRRVA